MDKHDYYQIMGVTPEASAKDIKTAYRRLARKYHPDLNKAPDAEARFKQLGEAYEILKDPEKRKEYDQRRRYAEQPQPEFTQGEGFDSSWFESLFTHPGARQRRSYPGADRQGTLRISLEDAYHGAVKTMQIPHSVELKVTIPAGIRSGQSIRLAGQGEPGLGGGPKGDLYLTIEIAPHPLFDVLGDDVYLTLPITPWDAALGATISVPTLAGEVELKIPPGSQGGQTLRLKHRGLPGKVAGNQLVSLKIMIPEPKTAEDKACYEAMAKQMPFNPRAHWGKSHG
jgi:curved DNA-binding protein